MAAGMVRRAVLSGGCGKRGFAMGCWQAVDCFGQGITRPILFTSYLYCSQAKLWRISDRLS
jgi:hypothetical protein